MVRGTDMLHNGAVTVHQGRIAAVGTWSEIKASSPADVRDLGDVTLVPGLVNAHTHLELSHLGLPPTRGGGYLEWVRWLITQPLADADSSSITAAAKQLTACGTAAVADITSRHPGLVAAGLDAQGIDYVIQYERFGYPGGGPLPEISSGKLSLAGHALYSTSPKSLREAKQWDAAHGRAFSIHLAEHPGEVELLATGTGDFSDFMRQRILPADFTPPGLSPVAWADELGLLDPHTLAVHAVHVSGEDAATLAQRGVTVCFCPRSNEIIGSGRANPRRLLDAGVPCCLGTDSLASAPDLDLWEELRALLAFADISESEALALVTSVPARVLGFKRLGGLFSGAAPRFAFLPPDLEAALRD